MGTTTWNIRTRARLAAAVVTLLLGGAGIADVGTAAASGVTTGATYVALGDSYAAGEGLGSYEAGTDVKAGPQRNVCHRSPSAFSQHSDLVLPGVDRAFWACSGAKSTDMMSLPPQAGGAPAHEQFGQPAQWDTVGPGTHWISLMAGGDDLNFGDVGQACAEVVIANRAVWRIPHAPSCSVALTTARALRTPTQQNLKTLYSHLLHRAPQSVLTVLGYPSVFPQSFAGAPTRLGSAFCILDNAGVADLGMPVTDAQNLDIFIKDINQTIQSAISDVRAELGVDAYRIQYADTYADSVPHNCTGYTAGATVAGLELSPAGQGIGGKPGEAFVSTATFHPTEAGQNVFAVDAQVAFENSAPAVTTSSLPNATVGSVYTTQLTTADHRTGTWSVTAGQLPAGLTLDGYTISGIPTREQVSTFTLTFTDLAGQTAQVQARVQVNAAPIPAPPPTPQTGVPYGAGYAVYGALGISPEPASGYSSTPVPVALDHVAQVAAASTGAFALRDDGSVYAWGDGSNGELGNGGALTSSATPTRVLLPQAATQIAAGSQNGYALLADGTVAAWGLGGGGGLGDGTTADRNTPTLVHGLTHVVAIGAGWYDGYAVGADGSVWAWGDNSNGVLGTADSLGTYVTEPVQVTTLPQNVISVAGGYGNGYALTRDGQVWAWGVDNAGQLGTAPDAAHLPAPVAGLSGVKAIAAGFQSAYALRTDGSVLSWGSSAYGDLGRASAGDSPLPGQVTGLPAISAISGGGYGGGSFAFAVDDNGNPWAWGDDTYGNLGDGQDGLGGRRVVSSPEMIPNLSGTFAVAAGASSGYFLVH